MYYVYILRCCNGSYYTGQTSNLAARLKQHKQGKGARYTNKHKPVALLYWFGGIATRRKALKVEKYLKSLPRAKKERLISGEIALVLAVRNLINPF